MDKQRVALTDDNWADYFSWDYPESWVRGVTIGEGGIGRDSGVVGLLLEWVAERSRQSQTRQYDMSRHDAAVLLEQVAGWPAFRPVRPPAPGTPARRSSVS